MNPNLLWLKNTFNIIIWFLILSLSVLFVYIHISNFSPFYFYINSKSLKKTNFMFMGPNMKTCVKFININHGYFSFVFCYNIY